MVLSAIKYTILPNKVQELSGTKNPLLLGCEIGLLINKRCFWVKLLMVEVAGLLHAERLAFRV